MIQVSRTFRVLLGDIVVTVRITPISGCAQFVSRLFQRRVDGGLRILEKRMAC